MRQRGKGTPIPRRALSQGLGLVILAHHPKAGRRPGAVTPDLIRGGIQWRQAGSAMPLAASGFAHDWIEPIDVGLNLVATAFVYDLAPHHAADVGEPGAGRSQFAPDTVHALTEDNLYPLGSLAQNHHLQGLAAFGHTNSNFFIVHMVMMVCSGRASPLSSEVARSSFATLASTTCAWE